MPTTDYPVVAAWCMECRKRVVWSNDKQTWLVLNQKMQCEPHVISATSTGRFRQVNTKTYRQAIRGKLRAQIAMVIRTLVEKEEWNDSEIAHYLMEGVGHEVSPHQVYNIRKEFKIPAAVSRGRPIRRRQHVG